MTADLELVFFSDAQGSGYITEKKCDVETRAESVKLGCQIIEPGAFTDLNGFWRRPMEYLGMRDRKEMVFYIGSDSDIMSTKHYFQSVLWVSQTRFWEAFKPGSGRDFNFVNGVWK